MKTDLPFKMSPLQLHCGHVRECPCLRKYILKCSEVMEHDTCNLLLNDFEKKMYTCMSMRERKSGRAQEVSKWGNMRTIGMSDKRYM